jgi:phage-related protein (TIGR01555 family)
MSKKRPSGKGMQKVAEVAWAPPEKAPESLSSLITNPSMANDLLSKMQNQNPGFFGGGNIPLGTPGGFPGGGSIQPVEDSTTMFENLRWYFVSNFRQLLSQAFVEIGLVQTICIVPVQDGLRGGIMIKSKQISEEEIHQLQVSVDRDDDLGTCAWSAIWERLYGGAGIITLLGDQDPEEPLNIEAITEDTELEFRDVDMWELFLDKQNVEGYDPQIQAQEFEFYDYYAEPIHKSRVMLLKGLKAPSFIRPRLRGWGVSVVETLIRSVNQYLKATNLSFEVLDEFKIDVYKIKNLVNTLLSPTAGHQVKQTVQMLNWQKNYNNAVVLDSEDDFVQKNLSFAGLAEAMDGIRMQVAADMRMPITKLFGTSVSKGFATDQNDMENYNSMIESEVRVKLKYHIITMLELKCMKLFGYVPEDLEIEFKPLRELSAVDQENVKTQKFTRLLQAKQAGLVSDVEFRDASNKGKLFDVELDTTDVGLALVDEDNADDAEEQADDGQQPGADRSDSRKVDVTDEKKTTAKNKQIKNEDFDEAKHPRAKDGKFGKGGGGSSGEGKKSGEPKGGAGVKVKMSEKTSQEENMSIATYGGFGHFDIAKMLTGKEKLVREGDREKAKKDIAHIDAAIDKSTLAEDTTVFRGMYGASEWAAKGESAVGTSFDVSTYWSTSADKDIAKGFTSKGGNAKNPDKDAVMFEMKLKSGQKALDVSEIKDPTGEKTRNEKEMLLPRGQKFKVTGFRKENGIPVYTVEAEETVKNSDRFDLASYEADGGDTWISEERARGLSVLSHISDSPKYKEAKSKSERITGRTNVAFALWLFKKLGGKL